MWRINCLCSLWKMYGWNVLPCIHVVEWCSLPKSVFIGNIAWFFGKMQKMVKHIIMSQRCPFRCPFRWLFIYCLFGKIVDKLFKTFFQNFSKFHYIIMLRGFKIFFFKNMSCSNLFQSIYMSFQQIFLLKFLRIICNFFQNAFEYF